MLNSCFWMRHILTITRSDIVTTVLDTRYQAVMFLLMAAASGCAPQQRPPLSPHRGLSYDALYLPFDVSEEQVRADLTAYQALGATRIYLTCTEADLDRDQKIRVILPAAHALGLEVFAGPYFAGVFSGDEGDTARLYLALHPNDREVSRRGQQTSLPAYNSPTLRLYLKDQLRRLLVYDFDDLRGALRTDARGRRPRGDTADLRSLLHDVAS